MKTYVFITRRICGIGGAEQYIYNKVKYLESRGWRVLVFSGRHGTFLIQDLRKFEPLIIPTLELCPECFSKHEADRVVRQIAAEIGDCGGDLCIIESNSAIRAVWAELVAERLHARHLAFILKEKNSYDAEMIRFLRFKYDRHELAGIAKVSVAQMLSDDQIEARDDTRISAFCNNVVDDCDDHCSELLDSGADYTFASIGRLEKPCVLPIIHGFRSYFQNHSGQKFNLVMIGGSPLKNREEQIRDILRDCDNVHLILTGSVYPIPRSFVEKVDVFVSAAGSATATYYAGRPTIRVHPVTGEPIGIIGYDFKPKEKSMFSSLTGVSIEECIERAVGNADKIVFNSSVDKAYYERMHAEFDRQLSFVNRTETNEYNDRARLMRLKTPSLRYHFLRWLVGHTIGGGGHEGISTLKKRVLNHE